MAMTENPVKLVHREKGETLVAPVKMVYQVNQDLEVYLVKEEVQDQMESPAQEVLMDLQVLLAHQDPQVSQDSQVSQVVQDQRENPEKQEVQDHLVLKVPEEKPVPLDLQDPKVKEVHPV